MTKHKSPEMIEQERLWRQYVATDPDLRRLEKEKRRVAHRRMRKAHYTRARCEAWQAIKSDLLTMGVSFLLGAGAGMFLVLLILLA